MRVQIAADRCTRCNPGATASTEAPVANTAEWQVSLIQATERSLLAARWADARLPPNSAPVIHGYFRHGSGCYGAACRTAVGRGPASVGLVLPRYTDRARCVTRTIGFRILLMRCSNYFERSLRTSAAALLRPPLLHHLPHPPRPLRSRHLGPHGAPTGAGRVLAALRADLGQVGADFSRHPTLGHRRRG